MSEELLSRSSQNIATLLQIVLLHEQNLSRLPTNPNQNNPLGDLINIVFTSENMRRNAEATPATPETEQETDRINARNEARNQARNHRRNQARYTEHRYGDLITPIYTECPITQETFQEADQVVMVRQCRHLFKTVPFHEWIQINQTCPYCRSPL
jgi:hypothetical protein